MFIYLSICSTCIKQAYIHISADESFCSSRGQPSNLRAYIYIYTYLYIHMYVYISIYMFNMYKTYIHTHISRRVLFSVPRTTLKFEGVYIHIHICIYIWSLYMYLSICFTYIKHTYIHVSADTAFSASRGPPSNLRVYIYIRIYVYTYTCL